jgi:TetR/AcrR family transcriptional regulator, copper-responsive repressor
MASTRGRPRSFDLDHALDRACEVFWTRGFSAASLDELSEAMGIARPSLYAAFGDKEQLYAAATARFRAQMSALYVDALRTHPTSGRDALHAFLTSAIDRYTSGDTARGCLAVCTATVEAPMHPRVRATLGEIVIELDDAFTRTLRAARDRGELGDDDDLATLGKLLSATLHSIAIRARAGVAKPELAQLARGALDIVFGPKRQKRRR